ncbi:MAG: prepilin-type N-terminal cleavage/methylation domain-containing protein [Myxococcales bacterium]|nr:prepilin-type N-terminal cleavage/methylation domain-containing protein [Myxococcales bacterium]
MRTSDARRGVTLIELMVSVAIISVILTAVTSVVVSISRQRRETSNLVDVRTNGRLALSMMQFDAANAGFRFGAPPFAVRVLQNVTGGEVELTGAAPCGGQAGWTVMPETDVIEFREGLANSLAPGRVPTGLTGCASGLCSSMSINFGAYPNPFELPGDGLNRVVFFSNATASCAGKLAGALMAGPNVQLLRQDLRTNAPAGTYVTGTGPGACPVGDMAVTALGRATRYLVCQPPANSPLLRPGLFRQVFDGTMTPVAGGYVQVQEAVEDLQVVTILDNRNGDVSGTGCTGTGLTRTCACDLTAANCTNYNPDATATGILNSAGTIPQRTAFSQRAYRVAVTTISPRARGFSDQQTLVRPALFDHPVGAIDTSPTSSTSSANQRVVVESMIIPQNIVMVTP